jgi:hypothetical protein
MHALFPTDTDDTLALGTRGEMKTTLTGTPGVKFPSPEDHAVTGMRAIPSDLLERSAYAEFF